MGQLAALAGVEASPPELDVADVAAEVLRQFGIAGDFNPLVSERDQNFQLTTPGGDRFVIKVTSTAEDALVGEFHIATLLHLEERGCALAPRVVRTTRGEFAGSIECDGQSTLLRIVTYLDGDLLSAAEPGAVIVRDLGARLAELDIALQGLSHPGQHPVLLWDLQRTPELRELLACIDTPGVSTAVERVIDDFERNVTPRIKSMRRQVIHGDVNPENVLIDDSGQSVSAFIDFSDSVEAPLVFDLAIAAAYLRTSDVDTLALIAPCVASYNERLPLLAEEIDVLFDLVRARLATTIAMLYWRLAAREEGDAYREKTLQAESSAIHFLDALDRLGREGFLERLRREPGLA